MSIDLISIGRLLKEKREEKGLSISDISDRLYIRKTIIRAIEEADWDQLPHEFYVKEYAKKYATLLGILPEILPLLYPKEEPPEENIVRVKSASFLSHPRVTLKTLLFLFLIVGSLSFILLFLQRSETVSKKETLQSANFSQPSEERVADEKTPPHIVPKKLLITCHERTWISVIIDGTEKKEFILNPRELVVLNAKERFDLLIGNAGGIRIFLDGKSINFYGESGEVKRLSLP